MLLPSSAERLARGVAERAGRHVARRADERASAEPVVVVQVEPAAREDVITLVCWGDGTPLERALRCARPYPKQPRQGARGGATVQVWYSSRLLAHCHVPPGAPRRIELGRQAGVRVCPASFRLHVSEEAQGLRTVLLISARARTPLEETACAAWPLPGAPHELQPCATELLSLRRALFG
jgi:hypothetical protein